MAVSSLDLSKLRQHQSPRGKHLMADSSVRITTHRRESSPRKQEKKQLLSSRTNLNELVFLPKDKDFDKEREKMLNGSTEET